MTKVDNSPVRTQLPELPPLSPQINARVADDTFEVSDRNDTVRRYAKEGALLGLKIGCGFTMIGIPIATRIAEMQGKKKAKVRRAKKQLRFFGIVAFPAWIVGGVGAGIGAICGAAAGAVKKTKSRG